MLAGRDIVSSGTPLSGANGGNNTTGEYTYAGNLFVHNSPTDISIASAGRDILYSSFNVAGPGTLELTAGRNIQMEDKVAVNSLGAVAAGDSRPGASIVMQAGMGPNGPDYRRFVEAYLNPANLAQPGESLQGGKVAKTYESELVAWLTERFGFGGDSEQARAYYAALPGEQQRIFARDVYFAELKAAGREYNQDGSVRQGSYVRGRSAIARLFPETDVAGNPITYKGDITMFGGAGVHTNFGGSIQMLTPGGRQTFGIEGAAPPSTAGVITQGAGDIQLYSLGSILLGQSRIMTTFGGSIMGWTSAGDINAGRGSKTTVVYTPPKRVYDNWGNVEPIAVGAEHRCRDRHAQPDPGSTGGGYRPDRAIGHDRCGRGGDSSERERQHRGLARGERGEYPDPGQVVGRAGDSDGERRRHEFGQRGGGGGVPGGRRRGAQPAGGGQAGPGFDRDRGGAGVWHRTGAP